MSEITTPPCPGCGERFAARGDMMALLKAHDAWKQEHAHPVPAVPVGVQPEPAEGPKWVDLFGIDPTFDVPAVPVVHPEPDLPAGYSGADNRDGQVTDAAGEERPGRGSRGVAESPAGKSHPEPGDRPEDRRRRERLTARGLHRDHLAFVEAEVAAAVAAVRADTVAQVEAALSWSDGEVSCGGMTVDADGCFAADLAARVRAALESRLG